MVSLQQIKTLLDKINHQIATNKGRQTYQFSATENHAHIKLTELLHTQAEQFSKDSTFWLNLGLNLPLPDNFGQRTFYVDQLYQTIQQLYRNLQANHQVQERAAKIKQLSAKAPPLWKQDIQHLFKKHLLRETGKKNKLSSSLIDYIANQVHQSCKLDKLLVDDEVHQLIDKNSLTQASYLHTYRKTVAQKKVARAVCLAATASGTLSAFNKDNLSSLRRPYVLSLHMKQRNTARWQKPAYCHRFFSPNTFPTFVRPYNNPNAIQSALDYLHLRLNKYHGVYVKPALDAYEGKNLVQEIDALFRSKHTNDKAKIYLKTLFSLWQGLRKESNLKYNQPIDQVISCVCLEQFAYYLRLTISQQSKTNYYEFAMDLLVLLIANTLRLNNGFRAKDTYYQSLIADKHPEVILSRVISAKKGREALHLSLICLLGEENVAKVLPGFPLPSVFKDYEHGYYEIVGLKGIAPEKPLCQSDIVRYLGRNSETCFELKPIVINQLETNIIKWCQGPTRILVVDLTIEKRHDELVNLIKRKAIQQLIARGKLQVVLFKSEQKQQSLGCGKFSAGSACLLAKQEQVQRFNTQCQSFYYDHNISGFFRHYASEAVLELIDEQTDRAIKLADHIQTKFPKASINANGPFILIGIDSTNSTKNESEGLLDPIHFQLQEICRETWPASGSFGFVQTTYSQWDPTMLRLSVGVEPIACLIEQFNKNMPEQVEKPTTQPTKLSWL